MKKTTKGECKLSIFVDRVIEKLDGYLSKNDYISAERHLTYWLNESKQENNKRAELAITNEQMGLYRKLSKENEALSCVENAIRLVKELDLENHPSGATAYLNASTVYKAFNMAEKSLDLFKKARDVYEKELPKNDNRLAGLYNNMGLTFVDLKRFKEAMELYKKAINVLEANENGELEIAITYLNMSSCLEAENGLEETEAEINEYVNKAWTLIDNFENKNGYYAFVCEKCASVFGYYGYFAYENELKERARRIYEGS